MCCTTIFQSLVPGNWSAVQSSPSLRGHSCDQYQLRHSRFLDFYLSNGTRFPEQPLMRWELFSESLATLFRQILSKILTAKNLSTPTPSKRSKIHSKPPSSKLVWDSRGKLSRKSCFPQKAIYLTINKLVSRKKGFPHNCPVCFTPTYFSLLARRRYSPTVIGFFCMLYWVNNPDWPVTTCWIGAGIIMSSMSS